ncbi:hypothetical protein LV89_02014 [Arcicella aurantiaca]|uniref:Uncharacterized protein n=1 Tax=Arcicella aurantiaca TaxID=591202 RepID=A0A316EET8_9BACT|nr:hypothetical protein [Arcicella aurantiaca]PWK27199.1 hypothetical protein LV89_02014 [Arcicella aurantiaca]
MSKFTIKDRGTFKVVTSKSGKRFYAYLGEIGLFGKIFIPKNQLCIVDSFQISLLESIIFSVNNDALTLKFWLTNRKKLAPNLAFFLESEFSFNIPESPTNRLNQMKKEINEIDFKDSFQDYYYSPINTLGYVEPANYPSIDLPTNSDSDSSSSSFDFGGGDTGGGGAGGDY